MEDTTANAPTPWEELPVEIWHAILGERSLWRRAPLLAEVCRRWRAIMFSHGYDTRKTPNLGTMVMRRPPEVLRWAVGKPRFVEALVAHYKDHSRRYPMSCLVAALVSMDCADILEDMATLPESVDCECCMYCQKYGKPSMPPGGSNMPVERQAGLRGTYAHSHSGRRPRNGQAAAEQRRLEPETLPSDDSASLF
ncbi:hypothetical protein QOT17_003433 [Balamuthia mandrillaris]